MPYSEQDKQLFEKSTKRNEEYTDKINLDVKCNLHVGKLANLRLVTNPRDPKTYQIPRTEHRELKTSSFGHSSVIRFNSSTKIRFKKYNN